MTSHGIEDTFSYRQNGRCFDQWYDQFDVYFPKFCIIIYLSLETIGRASEYHSCPGTIILLTALKTRFPVIGKMADVLNSGMTAV